VSREQDRGLHHKVGRIIKIIKQEYQGVPENWILSCTTRWVGIRCCYVAVDFSTDASQNGCNFNKLCLDKKINIIQKMFKKQ
jgi:hypothetical protein